MPQLRDKRFGGAGDITLDVMTTDPPPTKADWGSASGEFGDMDVEYAFDKFAGKPYEEAMRLFETTDLLSRVENLSFMPAVPFRYYILVYRDYVVSRRPFELNFGFDAPTAASTFLGLILEKLERQPEDIRPVLKELLPAAQDVSRRQAEYDADEDIYGRFPDIWATIQRRAANLREGGVGANDV